MTLLDEYRRAVYSSNSEERQRRLQPLTAQGARARTFSTAAAAATLSETTGLGADVATLSSVRDALGSSRAGTGAGKKRLRATNTVRLQVLASDAKCQSPLQPQDNDRQNTPQPLRRGPQAKQANKKRSRAPAAAASVSNQQDADANQLNNRAAPNTSALQRRDSLLEKISLMSALAVGRGGGGDGGGGSAASRTPKELPSQFIHRAHVSVSKWTVIVSDTTLFRLAARNKRIARTKARRLLALEHASVRGWGAEDASQDAAEPTRSLVLNGAEAITDAGLQAIADSVPTLEALEIASAVEITDAGLRSLALSCPSLARLNISSCRGVRGPGLGAIGDHARQMTELALADCGHLGEWVLLRCVYGFSLLERLDVARCAQVSDHLLQTLAHQCRRLRSLDLSDCPLVSDAGVVRVAQKCPALERIALGRAQSTERITDTCCAALGEHCPALRDVSLAGCNFLTDAAVAWLAAGCPGLAALDVSGVFYLTDAALRALGDRCRELRVLRLPNAKNVSDVGLRLLAGGCAKLETLHVSNLYLVSDGSDRDFGLEGLRAIATGCPLLKDANLSGCFQLVERALVALGAGCPRLQRLSLKACPKVTLAAVTALLRGCPHLAALNLSGVQLCDNAMLAAVGALGASLRELVVAQCDKVGDRGLRHLAPRADQFRVLDFSGCARVSDAGLNGLLDGFQRPALEHLHLVGCALLTQDSIARLAFVCPLLLTLSVHGCRVSPRVLQSLSSSWPLGVLRVPTASEAASGAAELGIFPGHRAKDRRFVETACAEWLAAVRIQNLFRARRARALALVRRDAATRLHVARRLQSLWRGRKARREALVRRAVRSGLEAFATKIQRRYRASRRGRQAQQQSQRVHEQQLESCARLVQRHFRAKRAKHVARLVVAAKQRQREREVRAVTQLQRRVRGLAGRKRCRLLALQRQLREREERDASLRIQTVFRGRAARRHAQELQRQEERERALRHQRATQLQAQFRRRQAQRHADARRQALRDRERAATKLQLAFRARRARQTLDVLKLASCQRERQQAARAIQRRWRTRRNRVGLALVREVRRQRAERRESAAVLVQRAFRRFRIRQRARAVLLELLRLRQSECDLEAWAATRVQAHWRRRLARRELERAQADRRARWKQLVDTFNQHGRGFGAPFYYNQVSHEIRWRMPRELLALVAQPRCDQCERLACASVECATCGEFFCDECHDVVHGRGRRRLHASRPLFDFYGVRRDYGDGAFPSAWPSEAAQDAVRGYDFVALAPTESYQAMLWQIAQFVPVTTGDWDANASTGGGGDLETPPDPNASTDAAAAAQPPSGVLFSESDADALGNSLWEPFFDYARGAYREYHRLSKRVREVQADEEDAVWPLDSERDSQPR